MQGLKCAINGNRLKLYQGSSEAKTSRKTVETQEKGETQKKDDDDKTEGTPKDEDNQSNEKGDTSPPLKKWKIEEVEVTQNSEPRSCILF